MFVSFYLLKPPSVKAPPSPSLLASAHVMFPLEIGTECEYISTPVFNAYPEMLAPHRRVLVKLARLGSVILEHVHS